MIRLLTTFLLVTNSLVGQGVIWNESNTIGLKPSRGWIKASKGENLKFSLATSSETTPFKGSIEISKAPTLNWTLDELWTEYVVKGFPELLQEYKKIDEGKLQLNDTEARWIECYNTNKGVKFQQLTVTFVSDNKLYMIICTSIPHYYEHVENDFWSMIKSIKIKNGG